ncbi:MAG: DsbA family protein [Solirubrobacteraceae bacterium]
MATTTTSVTADAIVLGEGPVRIDAYIDFMCPYCRAFEEETGPLLDELLDGGQITLAYHPVAFLDRLSTTGYSTRAASAARGAADARRFRAYAGALFAGQPDEGGPGLSDDELVGLGREAGLDDDFASGVREGRHRDWAAAVTEAAVDAGVEGIPTVLVDGTQVDRDPESIRAAITAAAS